ncbi:DUF4435 domain-containing protein [Pseudomonas sp. stari2]|uniref:DUF4435 domain-containing protein n=1 Tax=Pseudomonas sp. Stari2 TaxID=2954814 RepID=UPI00345D9843
MSMLEYSSEAINALSIFMRSDFVLFVEGDDDVLFWETMFSECASNITLDIRPVGGVNDLDRYVNGVVAGNLQCLVARDSDYARIVGRLPEHPKILYTYGYSIENTLYSAGLIAEVIYLWSRKGVDHYSTVVEWLEGFVSGVRPLFVCDILNFMHNLSVDTGAGHCQKFMAGKYSEVVDAQKVLDHVRDLAASHAGLALESNDILPVEHISLARVIRGHFLQSGVLRYINRKLKSLGRNTSVSQDALYAHAIQYLRTGFSWEDEEGEFYRSKIVEAIS